MKLSIIFDRRLILILSRNFLMETSGMIFSNRLLKSIASNPVFQRDRNSVFALYLIVQLLLVLSTQAVTHAGDRKFAFVYEVTTAAPGTVEYEQWITWKASKKTDSDFDRIEFRHELEFGLTEKLQLGLYLADWRYQDGGSVRNNRAQYRDTAVELIYNLTNPVTDPLGLALYGEVKFGDELFELEGKILIQKDLGPWTLAYNVTIEAEWEGQDYEQDKGEFVQTAGVSYQFSPRLLAGAELLHEVEFDDWEHTGRNVVYIGPNVSYRSKNWFVTVAPLFQVSNVDSEADFLTRMLIGIEF